MAPLRWDIFCRVIDNHGDIGVCWRLAVQLSKRGHAVRLWVDDAAALAWMAPEGNAGVTVRPWTTPALDAPGDVVVEAFGCALDDGFVAAMAARSSAGAAVAWVNLEYLSAEAWIERCHGLRSPVLAGPGAGLQKFFFYPGFTAGTGGLLREDDLGARQHAFDRAGWLRTHAGGRQDDEPVVSLFCYEPPAITDLLQDLARPDATHPSARLLVTAGRATRAVRAALAPGTAVPRMHWLPLLTQTGYDELLWACDLNFVRGEDSLVRALWAGKPFVWQIYPQDDGAHHAKLDAFLDWLQAPASLREFSHAWNGSPGAPQLPRLSQATLAQWAACCESARDRLLAQPGLCAQLEDFVCNFAGKDTPC